MYTLESVLLLSFVTSRKTNAPEVLVSSLNLFCWSIESITISTFSYVKVVLPFDDVDCVAPAFTPLPELFRLVSGTEVGAVAWLLQAPRTNVKPSKDKNKFFRIEESKTFIKLDLWIPLLICAWGGNRSSFLGAWAQG
jgi:hypothetical protein